MKYTSIIPLGHLFFSNLTTVAIGQAEIRTTFKGIARKLVRAFRIIPVTMKKDVGA